MNGQPRRNMMRVSMLIVAGILFFAVPSWCDSIFPATVTGMHCSGSLSSTFACQSSFLFFSSQEILRHPVRFQQSYFKGGISNSVFNGSNLLTGTFVGDEYIYDRCGRWTCVQIYAVTGTFSDNWNGKWNSPGTVSLNLTSSTFLKGGTVPELGTFVLGFTGLLGIWGWFRSKSQ